MRLLLPRFTLESVRLTEAWGSNVKCAAVLCAFAISGGVAVRADDVLHRYEGDILPYAPGAGWVVNRPCEGGCSEAIENGHLVVRYVEQTIAGSFLYNYDRLIARVVDPQPPTLWVEWGFRSEQPLPGFNYGCDGRVAVQYQHWFDVAYLFGDAAVSFSGDDVVTGLSMTEFHTHRFESLDGTHYRMSVDGFVFRESLDDQAIGGAFVQFGGDGGCGPAYFPTINEWDAVRYGTLAYGERIVGTRPAGGNAETLKRRDAETATSGNAETPKRRNAETRKHRNTETPKH